MRTLVRMQEALTQKAEAVERHREDFFANPEDIETIHHFRTNTRSLRSYVAFVKPWQKAKQNGETQAILKEIVRHTSRLRELDVFEKQARSDPDSSPEFLEFCGQEASQERAKVLKILLSKRTMRAFERAMELAKSVEWKKRYAKHGLPQSMVRARFDDMVESVGFDLATLRLCDAERTHDVRKRAKRVRYVAEGLGDLLGEDAVGIAKGMEAHQDDLGDVCDARVNIGLVGELLRRDLPEAVAVDLNLTRARNEVFLYETLRKRVAQD
ncbi:MAG: CHAD domain-containing protein [Coriobacteriales bacterium]|nr:CHAD domain-containing protein [Coriobacteriales bacterium]